MTVEFYDGGGHMPDNTLLIPGNTRPPEDMTEYLGWFAPGTTKEIIEEIINYTRAFLVGKAGEDVDGWIFKVAGRFHVSFTPKAWEDLTAAITAYERAQAASA